MRLSSSLALLIFLSFVVTNNVLAQNPSTPNLKWGHPTMEEMEMTSYAPDPEAESVILCKTTELSYEFEGAQLKVIYDVKGKMKILKPNGIYDAVIEVVYNHNKKQQGNHESMSYVKGSTYNLENGKIVKSNVTHDMISHDDIDKHQRLMTMIFPNVDVGSVIEYEYRINSDLYEEVRTWQAQDSIPVAYTSFDATFPEWFFLKIYHNKDSQLKYTTSIINNYIVQGSSISNPYKAQNHNFVGINLPAANEKGEIVQTVIHSATLPGQKKKTIDRSWESVDQQLLDDEDFGDRFKKNPLKNEMALAGIYNTASKDDKIKAIVKLLKSRVNWNGKYTLMGKSASKVLKEGSGSNSDINFILIAMLNDAGIKAFPAVLRAPDVLKPESPSIYLLSSTLVAIDNGNGFDFIDITSKDSDTNEISPSLKKQLVRVIKSNKNNAWQSL